MVAAATACSSAESSEPTPTELAPPPTTPVAPNPTVSPEPSNIDPLSPASSIVATAPPGSESAPELTASPTISLAPPITVVELAETGTPGLDSDDAFCASWSRFAGSFQVVAVTAAFGSGDAGQVAALEVAASPTVIDAYDELFEVWPDELESERELVADRFLGPFARRLDEAATSLGEVGADDATLVAISDAWLVALSQRDPSTPEFVVDLPPEIWSTIDEAADVFTTRRVSFSTDPSLVTDVRAPLTEQYLAVSCPDQGTLSGQEVDVP